MPRYELVYNGIFIIGDFVKGRNMIEFAQEHSLSNDPTLYSVNVTCGMECNEVNPNDKNQITQGLEVEVT